MPVVRAADAAVFHTHGSRFLSYAAPSRGGSQVCAWMLEVPADLRGTTHRPDREEVLLVLAGQLHVTLDGATTELAPGDVAVVPAGARLRVDAGPEGGRAWVTTTPGLQAVMEDGSVVSLPWAR